MEKIPISFLYNGKNYLGYLNPAKGMAEDHVWQVVLNDYFVGYLRYKKDWVFDGNSLHEMKDFFADVVIAWYQ